MGGASAPGPGDLLSLARGSAAERARFRDRASRRALVAGCRSDVRRREYLIAYGYNRSMLTQNRVTPQSAQTTDQTGAGDEVNLQPYSPPPPRAVPGWASNSRPLGTGIRGEGSANYYQYQPQGQGQGAAPASAPPSGPGYTPIDPSLYGLPYGEDIMRGLQSRVGNVLGRDPTTDPFYQRQSALADMMQRYATGQESVSQLQLRQAADANIAQQMAMAASARPGQAQLAALTAAQNAGTINTQLAGQSALAGIQERAAAQNALSGLLGTTRGQNLQ